ncbi:MAG: hypothetical protein FK731_10540 [Asgard group archaeon]|nr:hypothetical protein [Asgard group archaeon]
MPVLAIIIILGMIFFLTLMIISMSFYEAGTFNDHNYPKYNFYENYISDLGRKYTFTGESNFISQTIFRIAMMFGTITLIALYIYFLIVFRKIKEKKLGTAASIIGLIASFFCVSVAFTSFDLFVILHRICTIIFGFFILVSNIILFFVLFKIEKYPANYRAFFIITNSILVFYILISLIIGFDAPYFQEVTKIVTQKFAICLNFIGLGLQAYGLHKSLDFQNKKLKNNLSHNKIY